MLVDFVMAPIAVRSWVFDQFEGGFGAPAEGEGGSRETSWARWRQWLSVITNCKSIKQTTSERDYQSTHDSRSSVILGQSVLLMDVRCCIAENTAQSELAKASMEGQRVP